MVTKTETATAYPKRHVFTVEEVERIAESGGFDEDPRMELIRGELIDMAPIGLRHAACVSRLTALLVRQVSDRAIVWSQNPFSIPSHSQPQPDVALLRWRGDYYAGKRPTSEDAFLVIEVAETSLKYDRSVKVPLYAEAGIPEYWIINLQDNLIEVYSNPAEGAYQKTRQARAGETLQLPGSLEGALEVATVLGSPPAS